MPEPRLRHAVRALIVDERSRVLLCRFEWPDAVVWTAPGGGVEPGEEPLDALGRELAEEVGLVLGGRAPARVAPDLHRRRATRKGYDGILNDYYLVHTTAFEPQGTLSAEQLAAEHVFGLRWWTLDELAAYDGEAVFSPRALPALLDGLLRDGAPSAPLALGL